MSRIMEDMRNEAVMLDRVSRALEMLQDGQLSLETIAKYSGLSIEKVRELEEGRSA